MPAKSVLKWIVLYWVAISQWSPASEPGEPQPKQQEPDYGVVVEKVGKPSAPQKAGLQPGDLLLSWERLPNEHSQGEKGEFDNIFSWSIFLTEQTPRGLIKLYSERDGYGRVCEIPLDDWWGTEVRPVMNPVTLASYLKGKELVNSGTVGEGIVEWQKILRQAVTSSELACWLYLQMVKTWTEKRYWEKADAALDAALALADGPWSQIAVWDAIAETRKKKNQLDETIKAYQMQAEVWKVNSGKGLGFAKTLSLIGTMERRKGNLQLAEEHYHLGLKIREYLAPNSLANASSLNSLGILAKTRGDLPSALTYHKKALTIRNTLDSSRMQVGGSLNNLGNVCRQSGDLKGAMTFYKQALAIWETLGQDLEMAATFNNMGLIFWDGGDLEAARSYHERSLAIKERLVPKSVDVANSLNNLGLVSWELGDFQTANAYFNATYAILKGLAPSSLSVVRCLNNLGNLAADKGDLNAAENYYKQALAIGERLVLEGSEVAAIFDNLGSLYWNRGDFSAAETYYKNGLRIRESIAPDSLWVAESLNNLGIITHERGDSDASVTYLRRSLKIRERVAPGSLAVSDSFNNLGFIAHFRGNIKSSLVYFEKSLAIRANLAPGSLHVANIFNNLGVVSCDGGNLGGGVAYFNRALAIRENLASGSTIEAGTHFNLAKTYERMKKPLQAATHFDQSIKEHESQLGKLGGSGHVKAEFQGKKEFYYRGYIDFLLSQKKHEGAFDILERARARVLHRMISERELVFSGQDMPLDLERTRKRITHRIEKIQQELRTLSLTRDKALIRDLRKRKLEIRREYENVLEKIRKASPRLASLRAPKPLNLDETKNALDPGTILLSYCVTENQTYLFVVRKQAGLTVHTLEKGESHFQERIQELQRVIKDPGSTVSRSILDTLSIELFNELIAPAKQEIENSKRLLIIPDGPLQKLPFGLLQEKIGEETRYLIEWKPLTTVVSATIYAELKKRPTRGASHIAAFGDPLYSSQGRETQPVQIATRGEASYSAKPVQDPDLHGFFRDHANRALVRLPYTADEVASIAREFPEQTRLFLGEEANEQNVKALGQEPSIIHLACHGWVNDRFPLESALALTMNDSFGEGEENGILQAWEIFDFLRIDADLVVLSACETGLGKVEGVEGLTGLTRAFQFAGARAIIASYWNVEDQSTAALMAHFYRYLKAGMPKSEALRQAQIDLIRHPLEVKKPFFFGLFNRTVKRDVSHPFYWAPFQLIGPWD